MEKLRFLIQPKGIKYDPIAVEYDVPNVVIAALYANNKAVLAAVYGKAYEIAGYGPMGVLAGMFVPPVQICEGVAMDVDPSYTYEEFCAEFEQLCAARI